MHRIGGRVDRKVSLSVAERCCTLAPNRTVNEAMACPDSKPRCKPHLLGILICLLSLQHSI